MNVLGHAFVAEHLRPSDDAHTFGAVLPDLLSMARVRLAGPHAARGALAAGMCCHHAADAAFHSHPAFVAGAAALRRDLLDAGLATGPARAVAHAGYELALDATFRGGDVDDAYRRAFAAHALDGATLAAVRADGRARWRAFAGRVAAVHRVGPAPPDGPVEIAERLHGILRHRPRLAFTADALPAVAAVLARHVPDVRRSAADVTAAIVAAFASGPTG